MHFAIIGICLIGTDDMHKMLDKIKKNSLDFIAKKAFLILCLKVSKHRQSLSGIQTCSNYSKMH